MSLKSGTILLYSVSIDTSLIAITKQSHEFLEYWNIGLGWFNERELTDSIKKYIVYNA